MTWTLAQQQKRRLMQVWGGEIPASTGPGQVFVVPYASGDVSVAFALTRAVFRLETPGTTGDTELTVQRSPGGGAPTWSTIATLTLALGEYEVTDTGISDFTATSGQLLRINWVTLDAVAASPLIQVEGEV